MMVMMMLMVMMEIHYKTLKSEHIDETAWPGNFATPAKGSTGRGSDVCGGQTCCVTRGVARGQGGNDKQTCRMGPPSYKLVYKPL